MSQKQDCREFAATVIDSLKRDGLEGLVDILAGGSWMTSQRFSGNDRCLIENIFEDAFGFEYAIFANQEKSVFSEDLLDELYAFLNDEQKLWSQIQARWLAQEEQDKLQVMLEIKPSSDARRVSL